MALRDGDWEGDQQISAMRRRGRRPTHSLREYRSWSRTLSRKLSRCAKPVSAAGSIASPTSNAPIPLIQRLDLNPNERHLLPPRVQLARSDLTRIQHFAHMRQTNLDERIRLAVEISGAEIVRSV